MGGIFLKLKLWWEAADRTQRMVAVGGGAFLTILLAATTMFATKPHMGILLGGLSPQDQGKVVTALDRLGISSEVDEKGDIMVASDKIPDTRVKLAATGDLPSTASFGTDEYTKIGPLSSPDVERNQINDINEQRIAETIEAIDGVQSAQVHITPAENSPYTTTQHEASAAVTLTAKGGTTLGKEQGQIIASLVANSVQGLKTSNVVVLDSRMQMLFDGSSQTTGEGQISTKLATEQSEDRRNEARIQNLLDTAFGPGSTAVTVNCELDFDQKHEITDTSDPVKANLSKTEETMGSPKSGGDATVAPPQVAPGGSANGEYKQTSVQNQVTYDTHHVDSNPAAGTLKSMSIDVIVNTDKKIGAAGSEAPIAEKDVQQIVDGYLGADKDKVKTTVTPVAFDTTAASAVTKAASDASSSQRMQQIISMLPIVALLIVGILVMKSIGKFSKGSVIALAGGGALPIPYRPGSLPGGSGGFAGSAGGGGGGARGSVSSMDGGSAGMGGLGGSVESGGGGGGVEFHDDDEVALIKGISRKVNVPLEQIRKMSHDRPETVAMLIKGWLLEDR
jgi:flagellar M-ring protein FliF